MKKRVVRLLLITAMLLMSVSTAFAAEQSSSYEIWVETDAQNYSVGGTVTARIMGSGDSGADAAGAFQFTLRYDADKLRLLDLHSSDALGNCRKSGGGTNPTLAVSLDQGVQLSPSGTELAEATFRVQAAGSAAIGFAPDRALEITAISDYVGHVRESRDSALTLHDIQIMLNPGRGGLLNGKEQKILLYAGYDTPGLFLDAARTKPAVVETSAGQGFRLAETQWKGGGGAFKDFAALSAASFTESAAFTLQTVEQHRILFRSSTDPHIQGSVPEKTIWVDSGTLWETVEKPELAADSGYEVCWYRDDGTAMKTGEKITCDLALTPKACGRAFSITAPGEVVFRTGVADGRVHTGTEVTFAVETKPGFSVGSVAYTVDGGTPNTLTPDKNGLYRIPGDAVTGDVEILLETVQGEWSFITNDTYMVLEEDTKIAVFSAKRTGKGFRLTDTGEMYWSSKYGGYVQIVGSRETAESLSAKLTASQKDTVEIRYDGNLNGSTDSSGRATITAADTLPINALLHKRKGLSYIIDARMRLEMDVNGDQTVSTGDIMEILNRAAAVPGA